MRSIGPGIGDEFFDVAFHEADTDKSGLLEFNELERFLKGRPNSIMRRPTLKRKASSSPPKAVVPRERAVVQRVMRSNRSMRTSV